MDAHTNFATSTVATAPSPAISGTTLVVAAGEGLRFPSVPFNAVIAPATTPATAANAEIVRVTNISTDTLTITRTQESTSARTVFTGDRIYAGVTAKTLTDIERRPEFRPEDYGAVGDGTTDDWTAMNACVTAWKAATNGGILVLSQVYLLSPGTLKTPWRINANADPNKWWAVRWMGGHVILTTNMPGMFQPNRTTDNQSFGGLYFYDVAIDAGNVSTAECALFGSIDLNGGIGALSQRVNWHNIGIFGSFRVWNLHANGYGQPAKGAFALWIRHVYTNEGDIAWGTAPTGRGSLTQNTCTDICIDARVEIDGGDFGVQIAANLQRGETTGIRIKNYSGTTINWIASKDVGGVDTAVVQSASTLTADEWIQIGTGKINERRKVTARVIDVGGSTGSITIDSVLSFANPTEDANGADNGSPMSMGSNCNAWFDRIFIDGRGGYIKSGTNGYSSNIFICGHGIGRKVRVANFSLLEGSGDNAVEVDNVLDFKGYNLHSRDTRNQAFLSKNFNMPQDEANYGPLDIDQVHEWHNCTQEIRNYQPTATGSRSAGWYPGFNWRDGVKSLKGGASPRFGAIKLYDCQVIDYSPQFRVPDGAAIHAGPDCSFRRLELNGFAFIKPKCSDSAATASKVFYLRPNTDCEIIGKIRVILGGTATGGQPTIVDIAPFYPTGQPSTPNARVDLEVEILSTLAGVSSGNTHLVDFGNSATGATLGDAHGRIACRFLAGWASADTAPECIVWGSNVSANRISGAMVMDNWDTSRLPGCRHHKIAVGSSQAFQRKIVHTHNNILAGTHSNVADPAVTADYTATVSDEVLLVDATAGAVVVTLPAVAKQPPRQPLTIKKTDSSVNTVTIDGNASETIDGATTQVISSQYTSLTIVNTGTAWYIT